MSEQQLSKGDRVRFQYGTRKVQGVVTEDRGPIGIKGRHLYLIQFNVGAEYTSEVELPLDQLERVKDKVSPEEFK